MERGGPETPRPLAAPRPRLGVGGSWPELLDLAWFFVVVFSWLVLIMSSFPRSALLCLPMSPHVFFL